MLHTALCLSTVNQSDIRQNGVKEDVCFPESLNWHMTAIVEQFSYACATVLIRWAFGHLPRLVEP